MQLNIDIICDHEIQIISNILDDYRSYISIPVESSWFSDSFHLIKQEQKVFLTDEWKQNKIINVTRIDKIMESSYLSIEHVKKNCKCDNVIKKKVSLQENNESWRILIISGTVHWFWLKTSFHPLLWTSSGLTGSWKLSAYIGFGSLRSVKSVKTRGNWKPKKC